MPCFVHCERKQTSPSLSAVSFLRFIDAMMDMKDEFIYLPHNVGEMNRLECDYCEVGLPGTCGSVDVVHIINHTKGKEGLRYHTR